MIGKTYAGGPGNRASGLSIESQIEARMEARIAEEARYRAAMAPYYEAREREARIELRILMVGSAVFLFLMGGLLFEAAKVAL